MSREPRPFRRSVQIYYTELRNGLGFRDILRDLRTQLLGVYSQKLCAEISEKPQKTQTISKIWLDLSRIGPPLRSSRWSGFSEKFSGISDPRKSTKIWDFGTKRRTLPGRGQAFRATPTNQPGPGRALLCPFLAKSKIFVPKIGWFWRIFGVAKIGVFSGRPVYSNKLERKIKEFASKI